MNISTEARSASSVIADALAVIDARAVVRATVGSSLTRLDCLKEWDKQDDFYQGTPYCNAPAHLTAGIGLVMQFIEACQNASILLDVAIASKGDTHKQMSRVIASLKALGMDASALAVTLAAVDHDTLMLQQAHELQATLQRQGHQALDALSSRIMAGSAGQTGSLPARLH